MGSQDLIKQSAAKGFVGVILLAGFLLWFSPAYGGTILESFDNNTYNQDLWSIGTYGQNPTTAVTHDRLEITIPADASAGGNPYPFGGNIGSIFNLVGDFEVQVDFTLLTWPAPTGIQVGLGPLGGFLPAGVWLMSDPAYSPPQVYEAYLNGTDVKIGTSDNSGKLRLTRTGNTIQAFYWAPSGWQLITSRTDLLFGANCQIGMYALSHNFQGKMAQVAFDNIQIINGNVGNNPITSILQPLLLE